SLFRAAAGEARRLYGDTFPNDKNHRLSLVLRQPLGVVLAISPFNAPLVLLVKMIVFALAAGNAVIAKPSEETPLVALALARIASEAGMPPGVLNVVTGYGTEIGMALVEHPQIQGIAFTGSTSTGVRIGQAAMPTMKRLQLELGGKNPLIVLRDIDIEEAAHIAAIGAYYHAGQICMSGSRLIVERSIVEPFTAALVRRAQNLRLGDLRDLTTAYGPLINERALHKVQSHVDAALQAGGELVCGGTVKSGLTYNATVLYDVPMDCIAWREETFGPVASVVAVDDLEHALAIANDSVYGLSAGILTNDIKKGFEAARSLNAGAVHVGMHPFQSDAMAPVGGFGMSGMGRSGGKYSVEHFTELKWISVELGDVPKPF
ncbi:MAG TPA: aldehyde dehydrogenase family protein, partial [Phototrophicaceae bacterium]|nr:aldehyde dehydrogenase family protein [Phototrophicaceae bacterium]